MAVYSHSRLATFEDCPLKYKFQYVEKIPKPDVRNIESYLGSCVHSVLQRLYAELLLEKSNSLNELLDFFKTLWERDWGPDIRIVRSGLTPQHYFDYGAKCIRNFYEQYSPFNQSQTLKLEELLHFDLDPDGRYRFRGILDRLARRPDGTYEIHDYKTSATLPGQQKVDADRQLALYQIAIAGQWPDVRRVDLVWHFLGFRTTLRSRRTPEQLYQLRQSTIRLIDRVEQEKDFPPRKSALCDWCEYRALCPLWMHVDSVARKKPEEMKEDDGVRLVDEFAKARREAEKYKREAESLREKLIAFARQQRIGLIQGTRDQAAVSFHQKDVFPRKEELARADLEKWLKSIGRWEEVSALETSALGHVLHQEKWPPALLEELRRFVSKESSATVRITHAGRQDEGSDA